MVELNDKTIRTVACPTCFLCGSQGVLLYQALGDRIFDAPGQWNFRKCPNIRCGLLWLDPMPTEDDIGKAYQNYYTHNNPAVGSHSWRWRLCCFIKECYLSLKYGYRNKTAMNLKQLLGIISYLHPGQRAEADFSVMYQPALPGGRLLDVGCGTGQTIELMQNLGWQVEGVDFDPAAIENARNKGLNVRLGQLEEQQYIDNYFDVITMSHVIEHIHNPLSIVRECRRILKPGGCLVIVTPNVKSFGRLYFKTAWLSLDPPRHLHIFSLSALSNLVKKAGFKISRLESVIRNADGLFIASRRIKKTGRHVWGSPASQVTQIWALCMLLLEWSFLKLGLDLGEEIALIAEK